MNPFTVIAGNQPGTSLGYWDESGNIRAAGTVSAAGGFDLEATSLLTGEAGPTLIGEAATTRVLAAKRIGDAVPRWTLLADGTTAWGDGTSATDVNLYRYAAGGLASDAAALKLTAGTLLLGAAGDVALQYVAADVLGTPDDFQILGTKWSTHAGAYWGPAQHNFLAWTFDPTIMSNIAATGTAGVLNLVRIHVPAAITATNLLFHVGTAGVTLTAGQCFIGLWNAAGTHIGVSADQAAAWGTTGLKTAALAGGPFALPAGDYYIGYWFNGTIGPGPLRQSTANPAVIMNLGLAAPNLRVCSADTGLTTTAPATLGGQTAANIFYWAGIS